MLDLNIVIVSYNWPPRNAIGTHRPYAWARYWSDAGANVTVLTAEKQAFDEPLDLKLSNIQGVEVIQVQYIRKKINVFAFLKFVWVRRFARILKKWFFNKSDVVIDLRSGWYKAAVPEAKRLAEHANVVVSTFGPSASHLIANEMKRKNPDILWVADYRDLWSNNHISKLSEKEAGRQIELERKTVGTRADVITVVSESMAFEIRDLFDVPVLNYPNGFDLDRASVASAFLGPKLLPSKPMMIVYTGMVYEGYQDPTPLLDALHFLLKEGRIKEGDVYVLFYGDRVEFIRKLNKKKKYSPFIKLMGHVSRDESLRAQREADVLLLLESSSPGAKGVLTGKIFEYMVSGRPVLCIGSRPNYDIGVVLTKTQTGVVFGPEQLAGLQDFLWDTINGKGIFDFYNPDIESVMKYSRAVQSKDMLEVIISKLDRV